MVLGSPAKVPMRNVAKKAATTWSRPEQARQESNLQPPVLETGALPIELRT